ncbi:MAG TPA: hypothetical protein VFO69_13815 [Allosphingosinicella sp.]|nr:hypothetical protein [Allosphingosinicella sp.]
MSGQCVTLWIGPSLGAVERACLRSVLRQGHSLALYCYRPPEGVPDGVEIRDAADILPEETIIRHWSGSVSLFSNRFRYQLQRSGLGTWLDCDAYLLKPLDLRQPYLIGEIEPGQISTGVLRLPPDSPILPPLLALFEERSVPPWLPWRDRLAARWRLWRKGRSGLARMPWGSAGPKALTHLAREHGLLDHAVPPAVLYPLPWQEAQRIAREPLERLIASETVSIHVWNERIKHIKYRAGAPGSFLEQLQREGA